MKSFKFLGAMALLTGAMLVATGCNNEKKNEPASPFPTAEELRGTWQFTGNIPAEIQSLLTLLQTDVDKVMIYLDGNGNAQAGTTLYNFLTSYSYSEKDGSFKATLEFDPTTFPIQAEPIVVDAILRNTSVAKQIACTYEGKLLSATVNLKKISDDNLFDQENKPEPQDPEDPEDPENLETHIPTGVEIRGSWYIEGDDVPSLLADFEDLIAEIREGGQIIVSNDQMEFEGSYEYQEENGWMTVEFPKEGSNTPWYVSFSVKMYDFSGELVCTGKDGDQEFEFYLIPVIEEDDEE